MNIQSALKLSWTAKDTRLIALNVQFKPWRRLALIAAALSSGMGQKWETRSIAVTIARDTPVTQRGARRQGEPLWQRAYRRIQDNKPTFQPSSCDSSL